MESLFSSKGIKIGDKVRLSKGVVVYEGILMPSAGKREADSVVLKLPSGYNIGIVFGRGDTVERTPEQPKSAERRAAASFDKNKPQLTLIATGGTVASKIDYRTGGVSAAVDADSLLATVPELAKMANMKLVSPFMKMSEDMQSDDWKVLATEAANALNSGSEGVIITHGTDALGYTAAALSFMLKTPKPVVLTGSQKSIDRGSSDTAMNMICSAIAATSEMAEVGVCMHGTMNDDYCLFIRGTRVRKMNTVRRDAFRPVNDLPLAKIWPDGRIQRIHPEHARRGTGKALADTKFESKVALLKAYPGSDPSVMDFLVKKGIRGFVIEGMGLGHVPVNTEKSWLPSVKAAVQSGIPVVVCSQTIYGRVNEHVYSNLRALFHDAHAIGGEDMLAETAYVKLGWVLGHTKSMDKAREMMLANCAGEISDRTLPDTFLY